MKPTMNISSKSSFVDNRHITHVTPHTLNNRIPLMILGIQRCDDKLHYVVALEDLSTIAVPSYEMKQKFPDMVIDFFLESPLMIPNREINLADS
jgi:hypothetical protein